MMTSPGMGAFKWDYDQSAGGERLESDEMSNKCLWNWKAVDTYNGKGVNQGSGRIE